ncbi:MAG: DUF6446 family protein, partial [Gemmobacter sp.]
LLLAAVVAGGAMYYLQVQAFYTRLPNVAALRVALTDGGAEPLPIVDFEGIDAASSPLRFRACARLSGPVPEDAQPATRPEPLTAPRWFSCFDARALAEALARGEARAYLSEPEIARGVDRVVAVLADGRVYAWHQLNGTLDP